MNEEKTLLIESNLKLVGYAINKYFKSAIGKDVTTSYDDLQQAGYEGLIKAAEKFDENYGVKFSTYATCAIKNEIQNAINANFYTNNAHGEKELIPMNAMTFSYDQFTPDGYDMAEMLGCEEKDYNIFLKEVKESLDEISSHSLTDKIGSQAIIYIAEGYKYPEIEKIMGITRNQLKGALAKYRKKVQLCREEILFGSC